MSIRVIGIGDNVVDKYLHSGMMYPGGNALRKASRGFKRLHRGVWE